MTPTAAGPAVQDPGTARQTEACLVVPGVPAGTGLPGHGADGRG
jgi:hypothetical protein